MPKINGFYLKFKDHERGVLVLEHDVSGNCHTVPATPEEMRRFHVGEYYSLQLVAENFEHERRPSAVA